MSQICIIILLMLCGLGTAKGVRVNKSVLILHSYNQGLSWTDNLNRGLLSRLNSDSLISADIHIEYMDTKLDESEEYLKNFTRYFLFKYRHRVFDLIVSTDNAAFYFLAQYRDSFINKPPVVFCGLNYVDTIPPNFTGIMEDIDVESNIRNILNLHPRYKKLYVIIDRTFTGKAIHKEILGVITKSFPALKYEFLTDYSFAQLKSKLSALTEGDIVFLTTFNTDKEGKQILYDHILEQINPYCKVPVYGTWDFYLGKGITGGKVTRAVNHAEMAASIALEILKGEISPSAPVINGPTEYVFDNVLLKKYKISKGELPPSSLVINTRYSFIQENSTVFIFIAVVFFLLLSVIFIQVKLFKKEKQIRKKEHLFLQELKNKSIELEEALKLAEKSNDLKNAFLSNLSHEIRTPMNAIVGFSDLLVATSHDSKQEEYVSIIRASSTQLLSIINDIMEMSMIDTNQVQLHFTNVDISKTIDEVLASYAATLSLNGRVTLTKNIRDAAKKLHVITDQARFKTILSNLISNAVKFTEIGYVEIGYSMDDRFVSFYVKDTGVGIDPQYHKQIFERFRKIESSNSFSLPGLGIGLTLSEAFVKLLGGEIWLESEPGKGSTFHFTIPAKRIDQAKVASPNKEPDMNNHLILICEDDESNILFYKELFKKTNASILWAKNGKEAVKICNENLAVELVLMDLKMPGMNGWEATKIIKQFRPDLPVIAQTAHVYSMESNQLSQKGFDDYITKPVKKSELFEKISRYIYCFTPIISLFVIHFLVKH